MKTKKKYLLSFLLFFAVSIIVASNIVRAAEQYDRMTQDDGSKSSGKGMSTVQKTNRSLLDAIKILFSGSPSSNTGNATDNNNVNSNSPDSISTDDSQTYTPPPNINAANEIQFADIITKLIHDDCTNEGTGVVTKKNTINSLLFLKKPSCTTRVSKPLKSGAEEVTNSVSAFYYLQCVACARAMSDARGRSYSGTGSAKEQIDQKISGYSYFKNEQKNFNQLIPGSIGISNEGTFGHIFYITEVYKNSSGVPKAFKAFECNYGAKGYVRHDKTRPLDNYMAGWQRPNSL